jgi:hypothetical protein
MKQIPLTQGKFAIVDDADYERLSKFRWFYNGKYAVRQNRIDGVGQRIVFMHREIMQTPDGMQTDHANGDKLCNLRRNLRSCTRSQNGHNAGLRKTNTSGFKGVSVAFGKWKAQIGVNGKKVYLGLFSTPEEASLAHDTAEKENYGNFSVVNREKVSNE